MGVGVDVEGVVGGVLRGGVVVGEVVFGDVVFGVDAGPVLVGEGVPDVPAEGALVAPELGAGLVGPVVEDVPPDVLPPCCVPVVPVVPPAVDGAAGDVGTPEPPSARPPLPAPVPVPVPVGDASLDAVAGAELECVGVLAARLSIEVPIVPPCDEDDVVSDDT